MVLKTEFSSCNIYFNWAWHNLSIISTSYNLHHIMRSWVWSPDPMKKTWYSWCSKLNLCLCLETWWRIYIFSLKKVVFCALCIGEQCAEAELWSTVAGMWNDETLPSIQDTSWVCNFWKQSWGNQSSRHQNQCFGCPYQ